MVVFFLPLFILCLDKTIHYWTFHTHTCKHTHAHTHTLTHTQTHTHTHTHSHTHTNTHINLTRRKRKERNQQHTIVTQDVEPGTIVHADTHMVGTNAKKRGLHFDCYCHWMLLHYTITLTCTFYLCVRERQQAWLGGGGGGEGGEGERKRQTKGQQFSSQQTT